MRLLKIAIAVLLAFAVILTINSNSDSIYSKKKKLVEIATDVKEIANAYLENELTQEEAYEEIEQLYNQYVKIYETINFDKLENSAKKAGNHSAASDFKRQIVRLGTELFSIKSRLQPSDTEVAFLIADFDDYLKQQESINRITKRSISDMIEAGYLPEGYEITLEKQLSSLKYNILFLDGFNVGKFSKEKPYFDPQY